MAWYSYVLCGLTAVVALVWITGLVLCHRAGQVQVLIWEKACGDEAMAPQGNHRPAP